MKKITLLFLMILTCFIGFAQQTEPFVRTFTVDELFNDGAGEQFVRIFTGLNDSCRYVQLDSVVINKISNDTLPFRAVLVWPDTTLEFTVPAIDTTTAADTAVGIGSFLNVGFQLEQNAPNPFNGTTIAILNLSEAGRVSLEVFDMFGRTVAGTTFDGVLAGGQHQFRIHLNNAGAYVLAARQKGRVSSVKMINRGEGGSNRIEFIASTVNAPCLQFKTEVRGITPDTLNFGNQLEYVGYATVHFAEFGGAGEDVLIESRPIIDTLDSLQLARYDTLLFNCVEQQPQVQTAVVGNITHHSAVCGGKVIADGGAPITERGLCWSKHPNPTIDDTLTTVSIDGAGLGEYVSYLPDLEEDSTYYVRAYATNYIGTAYGEEIFFKTWKMCDTVTDVDSNVYLAVQIGNQCWMKENLRTTRYTDSTEIALGTSSSTNRAYRYYPNNDEATVQTYGYLYNWKAVTGENAQNICPTGWHVPSDAEWTELKEYMGSRSDLYFGNNTENIAKALASDMEWNSSTTNFSIGKEMNLNNATGFTALPAGSNNNGSSNQFGQYATFWSSTEANSTKAYMNSLFFSQSKMSRNSVNKYYSLSIRCLRDEDMGCIPTSSVHDINIEVSELPYTFGDTTFEEGTVNGTYTLHRTNVAGCDSTITINMTVRPFTCGEYVLVDIDSNSYNTVQIGHQCWMQENLRTTRYADGSEILFDTNSVVSSAVAYRYYPNNDSTNVEAYGYLYNWRAVMYDTNTVTAYNNTIHDICPTGWHVPTVAEWNEMASSVASQSDYCCDGNSNNIAKALASVNGWASDTTSNCTVGNFPENNNMTGFSVLPAGCFNGNYSGFGENASFWSTTEVNATYVYGQTLYYNATALYRNSGNKNSAFSVRCVCD